MKARGTQYGDEKPPFAVEREQSFDAWGNPRNSETWTGTVTEGPVYDRGYTGHEHITAFGLINMNGRCYDPVTSSFLSVDAYVQSPDNSQSFNRYSYCQNNPLRYTDPTGWQLVGGTRPRPQGFYDKWGDYYSRPAYEPRDFGLKQLSDVNPDIAWMEANDMRGGVRNETLGGGSPVYDEHGYFLGTDDGGLQGVAIVMRREDFRQGMKHDDALALAVDLDDNDKDAEIRLYMHYSQLCNRPDWDGYLTLSEANEWYRDGSGEPLFADLSQIDLSSIASYGERQVGKRKTYNLLWYGNPITDGLVYGNITLKYYPDHIVRAYADLYDFDMKPWRNPLNWGRNIETMIGNKVAGNGTPFNIYFYGSYQLTPIFPWIK